MTLDEHYICQRAANAIISEIGPYRVSTDALQAINQFLDEFIVLLLTSSLSLDLSQIKSVVFSLLPSTLGKNAIVEAELEVKTFTETESIDFELYERMRALSGSEFPLSEALPLLREKCFEFCTLADKEDQLYVRNSARIKKNEANMKVVISPIVAIYVTTVMEHIAEYLLTAVAMSAEHEDTDYVRVKEVFLALVDDVQLGNVFNRMDLKDKMGKRAGLYVKPTLPLAPSPLQQVKRSYAIDHNSETGSFLDITFDDLDLEYFEENQRKSTLTIEPRITEPVRPQSAMSNNNRKSTFHLFKNNRNSFSSDVLPRAASPDPSAVYDPDAPANAMNFEDLIKSGGTVRVSLTPNRLRSIEVKDSIKEDDNTLTWERRSISSPRLSTVPNNTNKSSVSIPRSNTLPPARKLNHEDFTEASKPVVRPQTPSSPLVKPAFVVNEAERFENPREAPKPPIADPALTIPVATPSASPSPKLVQKNPTPLSKLPPPADTPSPNHTEKKPSITAIPSSHVQEPAADSATQRKGPSTPLPIVPSKSPLSAPEQPPLPKPTATRSTSGMVIRRGSMSNKKSRENLRKAKEEEERQQQSIVNEPLPTPPAEVLAKKDEASNNIEKKEEDSKSIDSTILSEEPLSIKQGPSEKDDDDESLPAEHKDIPLPPADKAPVPRLKTENNNVHERPSSIVAKRTSMIGNSRRRSMHENYAAEKHQDISVRSRGSVSVSIKQWDDILKPGEQPQQQELVLPGSQRRSVLRQLRQQQLKEQQELSEQQDQLPPPPLNSLYSNPNASNSNTILDKVLKFERASSLDDAAHRRVSHMPRRERFLYLQQDPSAIERKSSIISNAGAKTRSSVVIPRVKGIDQGIQTEPEIGQTDKPLDDEVEEEQGLVDGDEEWFLQDDEWDEQEETAIVEWLLGE
ncbi:hypothetical protein A0J61_01596 [Choanephora cucurbitarum]|uniref:Uncharacterized protein n=1 Tax=Choanephora cucurbitarum TaxID=101091 RepID=A0A1C7NMQ8_9FUNG|nr:hypothetical protein A0J61_01596 [Choanephora cucurbitarum]